MALDYSANTGESTLFMVLFKRGEKKKIKQTKKKNIIVCIVI